MWKKERGRSEEKRTFFLLDKKEKEKREKKTIRILGESKPLHISLIGTLLEGDSIGFKLLGDLVNIIGIESNMAKSSVVGSKKGEGGEGEGKSEENAFSKTRIVKRI